MIFWLLVGTITHPFFLNLKLYSVKLLGATSINMAATPTQRILYAAWDSMCHGIEPQHFSEWQEEEEELDETLDSSMLATVN